MLTLFSLINEHMLLFCAIRVAALEMEVEKSCKPVMVESSAIAAIYFRELLIFKRPGLTEVNKHSLPYLVLDC